MTEEQAYEKLQTFLGIAEELISDGAYSLEEMIDELTASEGSVRYVPSSNE
jgi:hypothetical protein